MYKQIIWRTVKVVTLMIRTHLCRTVIVICILPVASDQAGQPSSKCEYKFYNICQ